MMFCPSTEWGHGGPIVDRTDFAFDGITWGFRLDGRTKVLAKGWADSLFDYDSGDYYHPHTSWGLFGPVMEKHPWCLPRVNNVAATLHLGAYVSLTAGGFCYYGPTPLVAACRSYVAYKLGGEVEVPDFLE
jgi:hypothetical protein